MRRYGFGRLKSPLDVDDVDALQPGPCRSCRGETSASCLFCAQLQAEYDVFTALQMTQSALDEQMVVSVALARSGRANASRHDDDKDVSEDEETDVHPLGDEEPEESTDPNKVAEDDFGDAEDEDDLHLEVPAPDGHEELQIEENSSLAKNGRYRPSDSRTWTLCN